MGGIQEVMACNDSLITGIISDETIDRCLRLLEVWMDENPECDIICEQKYVGGERFEHKLTIKRRGNYGKE